MSASHPPLQMPAQLRTLWTFAGVPVALILALGLIWHIRPATHAFRDLTQDWLSARCYFNGQSIYTRHHESVPAYLGDRGVAETWPVEINAHPPVLVLLLLPLGLLPHDLAVLLWNLLSLVMIGAAMWIVFGPRGLNCEWRYFLASCCIVAGSTPLAAQGATAQLNGLLVLLIALAWSSARRDRQIAAGIWLGLAVASKLFPAFLLVYFLATRRWQAVIATLTTIVLLHVAALFVLGTGDLWNYFVHVVPEVRNWQSAWLNCSIAGFWSRLFDVTDVGTRPWFHAPLLSRLLIRASCGALTAAVAWHAWRARSARQHDLAFAAVLIAMLLASPLTWDHSLLLLILPIAILWYYLATTAESQLLLAVVLIAPGYVPAYHLWRLLLGPASLPVMNRLAGPWQSVTVLALVTYCLVCLLALAMYSPQTGDEPAKGHAGRVMT